MRGERGGAKIAENDKRDAEASRRINGPERTRTSDLTLIRGAL
jgi:hypothetical protein